MTMKLKLAVAMALAAPVAGFAQTTGVSHPEEVPVTTSPEGIAQPVVFENGSATITPVAAPELKARAAQATPQMPVVEARPVVLAEVVAPVQEGKSASSFARGEEGQIVERVPGPANALPIGAMLKIRVLEDLSTGTTAAGTAFTGELLEPMERDGRVLLPAGSLVKGRVTEVHGGKRFNGSASMHLLPTSVTLPDGTIYGLQAQVIDTDLYRNAKVDGEGTIVRKDHAKGTLAAVGLSTGSGAAVGGILGGWPGALIGAGVSAGISTVVWLRQDHQTELPAGTGVTLQLTGPLTVDAR